jgi:(p)ppGpp synthase/HD superfamily hydrolase
MFSPERYVEAMRFAAAAHDGIKVSGSDLPYLVHVVSVAAEVIAVLPASPGVDGDLAVTCALLHDTVEDTPTTIDTLRATFGERVAAGVDALTKRTSVLKADRMADSLRRIREQPAEIAMVKLADRITNLSEPPVDWTREKRLGYRQEARVILEALGHANAPLAARLAARIESYLQYCG